MDWQLIFVTVAIVAAVGIVIGRRRGHSRATIALDVAGYVIFMGGLGWATGIGRDAFLAAGAASLGSLMFTTAAYRDRRREPTPVA